MIGYFLIASAIGLAGWLYSKSADAATPSNPGIGPTASPPGFTPSPNLVTGRVNDEFMFLGSPDDPTTWPIVTLPSGEQWQVAPSYIGPVGIGEAQQIAASRGMQLPSPALVDAIWRAADLKVSPIPEASDGTAKTMASNDVYLRHKTKVDALVDGRNFTLLAGTHKDVVVNTDADQPGLKHGGIGLYGWHAGADMVAQMKTSSGARKLCTIIGGAEVHAPVTQGDGLVIQQPFGGHGLDWIDYSQGARLVRKV